MGVYKGFDKTVVHLTRYDGEASKVECLICRECQAIILQHGNVCLNTEVICQRHLLVWLVSFYNHINRKVLSLLFF